MTTRSARSLPAALLATSVLGTLSTIAAQSGAGAKTDAGQSKETGHEHMIAELQKILERTDGENELLGSIKVRTLKDGLAKLPANAKPEFRFKLMVELGDRMVYYGEEREGLKVFQQA